MKSIGQILKAARQKKGYTISEVNELIKIHPKYIKALEEDNYSEFQGKVHSKGFLKIYTKFLGLDEQEILALWRREYEPTFADDKSADKYKTPNIDSPKLIITPTTLFIGLSLVIVMAFFTFLFFQYREFTDAPTLNLYYPEDNIVLQSDVLDITGKVELDSEVFINSQKILTNTDGTFLTSVKLREGINTISIKAVNKLSKETELIRNIIYRPEQPPEVIPDEVEETTPSPDLLESTEE